MATAQEVIEILIRVRDEASKKLQKANLQVKKNGEMYKSTKKAISNYNTAQTALTKATEKASVPFAGYAMSLMFFGMALQKMFSTIWKSSTKTFQDVMHSVEGTTTQFDMMQGSLKYLGFVIGEALEPAMTFLAPIIDFIAEFVSENPNLTRTSIIWLGIVGSVAMIGGSAKLAADGFKGLALQSSVTSIQVSADATVMQVALLKVLEVANKIGRVLGTLIILDVAMNIMTDDDTQKAFNEGFAMLLVGAGLLAGLTTPIGAAAITVGVILKLLPDKFKTHLFQVLGGIFGIVVTAVTAMIETVLAPIAGVYNTIRRGYNLMKGLDLNEGTIDLYAGTAAAATKTADLFSAAFGNDEADQRLAEKDYSPTFIIHVDNSIDGEALASNTSTRIMNEVNSTTTGTT